MSDGRVKVTGKPSKYFSLTLTTAVDYSLDLDGGNTPPSDQYRIGY